MAIPSANSAVTDLATQPITKDTSASGIKPNLMFVLDDSGSMQSDFLPDWADPLLSLPYLFKNASYNGIAYNPGIYYRAPAMYDAVGALDTTTYPSQTGTSAAAGANTSSSFPNWTAVKNDGYGVQATTTANLVDKALFYTTVPGEYCTSPQLKNCTASSVPTGAYTYPAPLRWCNTMAQALGNTAGAQNVCQAAQIASTANNTTNGITSYTFARSPVLGKVATITFGGAGTLSITSITGDAGVRINAATITGAITTSPEDITALLNSIVTNINACTTTLTGGCTATGYSAATDGISLIMIASPAAATGTPVVTRTVTGSPTVTGTAFSNNGIGSVITTQIISSNDAYPYPGTSTKASTRIDCAGTTCTYTEEMTNYANWWAYYRTRMQTMKTGASLAFSTVDDKFRVGYFSLNNGSSLVNSSNSDFLDIKAFSGAHKHAWYAKFFNATPFGGTPLRTALSRAGQIYAGTLDSLYDVTITDPLQYSCQSNFTILSTDGYWNDSVLPTRLDKTTAIGQQDGDEVRPYYDGTLYDRTSTQTLESKKQVGETTFVIKTRSIQLKATTSRLTKAVQTTTTYPAQVQTSTLQRRQSRLTSTTYPLQQTKTYLQSTTYKAQKTTIYLQKTTYPLIQTTRKLTQTTYPLQKTTTYLRKTTYPLIQTTRKLTQTTYPIQQTTTTLQKKVYPITRTSYKLQAADNYVQMRTSVSTNGGDSYGPYSEWANAATCTENLVGATTGSGASAVTTKTQCRYSSTTYIPDLTSCTTANPAAYTGTVRSCTYQASTTSTVTACSVADGTSPTPNTQVEKVQCAYSATPSSTTNTSTASCTDVTSSTFAEPKVTCTYGGATTSTVSSCTVDTTGTTSGGVTTRASCAYSTTASGTTPGLSACTNSTTPSSANGTVWSSAQTSCAYAATTSTSTETSCTVNTQDSGAAKTQEVSCAYSGTIATGPTNTDTCTAVNSSGTNDGSVWAGPRTTCAYGGASTVAAATCTVDTTGTLVGGVMTRTSCGYSTTASGTTSGLSACTNSTTPSSANGTLWSSGQTSCIYAPSTSTSTETSCTVHLQDGGAAKTQEVSCAYSGTIATGPTNTDTCTAINSSGNTNGTVWAGPRTVCAYGGATTVTNLNSCTSSTGDDSNGTGTPGGVLSNSTCSYMTTGTTVIKVSSCTPVAQDTVNYTNQVVCGYGSAEVTTVTTGVTTPSTCNPNPQSTGAPYSATAISCLYLAPTVASDQATCSPKAQSSSSATAWEGPAVTCAYQAYTPWVNATAACTTVAQSPSSDAIWQTAVGCQYTSPVASYADTCTGNSIAQNYVNLTAKSCTTGPYVVAGTSASTIVDTCTPGTTSPVATNPGTAVTATTCAYNAAVTTDVGSCTNVAATSTTTNGVAAQTAVTCSTTDTGFVASPSCAPIGTYPNGYDGTGKIVVCSNTGLTTNVAVSSCSASTGSTPDWIQKTCSTLYETSPTPVQTCAAGTTGDTGNNSTSYIATTCTVTSPTATVSSCTAESVPTAPYWRTVTCTLSENGPTNTLADVAEYYYKTDLRSTALSSKCDGTPVSTGATANDVCENVNNISQNMRTFTLGLGASGFMQYSSSYESGGVEGSADYDAVKNGTSVDITGPNGVCAWQSSGQCNWPKPESNDQSGIDDLWHAGVNGRGAYFSATDPDSLASSISSALASVAATEGSASPSTTTNVNLTEGSVIYSGVFTNAYWTGDVLRYQINNSTGASSDIADWSAQNKLDVRSGRLIYTYDSSAANGLKEFTATNYAADSNFLRPHIATGELGLTQYMCTSPTVCLTDTDKTSGEGANLVNFLRGTRTNEGLSNTKYYRVRQHILGDIVNAQPAYVGVPRFGYGDLGYTTFVNANVNRKAMVYAGANDGMLHAFKATGSATAEAAITALSADPTDPLKQTAVDTAIAADVAAGVDGGREEWAYIPASVRPNLYKLADKNYSSKHQYYVDGTPVTGDICINNCGTSSAEWRTILVGGLNRGGRSYYALDITDPTAPQALWEFKDTNLGYSYGNPAIAKVKNDDGTFTWAVIFTSGYNNVPNADGAGGDGVGRLYILDAYSGTSIREISTGYGSAGSPSGLAKIAVEVIDPVSDASAIAAYGADLYGNLWRFDISNVLGASGYDAQLITVLHDEDGNRQPVTTIPQVGRVNGQTMIYVGTGSFLALSDAAITSTQTVYAVKDTKLANTDSATALYSNVRESLVEQVLTKVDVNDYKSTRTISTNAVNLSTTGGWFVDLIDIGERANTNIDLSGGKVTFTTNVPNDEACSLGGYSLIYSLDYRTGSVSSSTGIAGVFLSDSLASGATSVGLSPGSNSNNGGNGSGGPTDPNATDPTKSPTCALVTLADGNTRCIKFASGKTTKNTRRASWRELTE
ncbi:PilC/PilY family type IV pilus protein [Methylovorus sp. MM2]|uniref:PilC/PilY family type IV pilus protein n=1 Tax=Methylovorus sp. MM2 TaxID=1848038 RepID=UPI0013F4C01E|nr:PilC/PilY family type IV pilus protein [Methylovorus sp. MM2]